MPIVLGVAALCAAELRSQDINNMEQYKVIPEVIPEPPKNRATVKYGNLEVDMGNELTPTEVKVRESILLLVLLKRVFVFYVERYQKRANI